MFKSLATKLPAVLTAASLAVAFAASPAHAGLEIQLQSGGTTYTQSGSSPLVVSQSIGNFTTTADIGTSTLAPTLDLSSVDISSSAGGTLIITLSADGFTSPVGAATWLSQFSGNFLSGQASVTLQTYVDVSNTLLGTGTLLSTLSDTATPFGLSATAQATTNGLFALTEVLTIVTTGETHVSLDASIAAPEPASVALLSSSLIGLGIAARRKRKAA
ncbi:MAG: hypothetical protein QOF70_1217 [Acetobacteraceae bacterium]|jgi:hypothetical protein|nr:sorting protein [Rhodopila sp.]MEA2726742.1 hypothetical protein [Acetobacteraceae bacterium]